MADSQRVAFSAELAIIYGYLISNKLEWNNCFIKTTKRIAIFELPSCFRWHVSATTFVVNCMWAHILLSVNQSKRRNCYIPLLVFNNKGYPEFE